MKNAQKPMGKDFENLLSSCKYKYYNSLCGFNTFLKAITCMHLCFRFGFIWSLSLWILIMPYTWSLSLSFAEMFILSRDWFIDLQWRFESKIPYNFHMLFSFFKQYILLFLPFFSYLEYIVIGVLHFFIILSLANF